MRAPHVNMSATCQHEWQAPDFSAHPVLVSSHVSCRALPNHSYSPLKAAGRENIACTSSSVYILLLPSPPVASACPVPSHPDRRHADRAGQALRPGARPVGMQRSCWAQDCPGAAGRSIFNTVSGADHAVWQARDVECHSGAIVGGTVQHSLPCYRTPQ